MSTRSLMMAALLQAASLGTGRAADTPTTSGAEGATMKEKSPIEISVKPTMAGGKLRVEYSVVNRSDESIFIFDRMWDVPKDRLDVNWAYVAVAGKTVVLKRAIETKPDGLAMEILPEPYGRELAPGARASGSFRLALPLEQSGAYDFATLPKLDQTVSAETVEMRIGWCRRKDFGDYTKTVEPFKEGAETLWPFSYYFVEKNQKIAKSAPVAMRLRIRAAKP